MKDPIELILTIALKGRLSDSTKWQFERTYCQKWVAEKVIGFL